MSTDQIKKILVAVDFSGLSIPVLKTAVEIASQQQSELTLLHVLEPFSGLHIDNNGAISISKKEAQLTALNKLKLFVSENYQGEQLKIKYNVQFGSATNNIIQSADRGKFQLIIMGTHGVSGIRDFFIGSTAYRVIKHSFCPVLTIPNKKKESFDKILFPVRLIPHALDKYEFVQSIARQNHSELVVLGLVSSHENETGTNEMKRQLNYILDRMNEDNIISKTWIIHTDNFASEVLIQARSVNADLIVATASLDYEIRDFFVGPFVQQIVNHSEVPVLSIRPKLLTRQPETKKQNEEFTISALFKTGLATA